VNRKFNIQSIHRSKLERLFKIPLTKPNFTLRRILSKNIKNVSQINFPKMAK